jgi:hypothetical protein
MGNGRRPSGVRRCADGALRTRIAVQPDGRHAGREGSARRSAQGRRAPLGTASRRRRAAGRPASRPLQYNVMRLPWPNPLSLSAGAGARLALAAALSALLWLAVAWAMAA